MNPPRNADPLAGRGAGTGDAGRVVIAAPLPPPVRLCGRCKAETGVDPEMCWYCETPLCGGCFDEVGHCGHPQAVALNQAVRDHQAGDPPLPHPWVREEVDEWAASFDGPVRSER